MRGLEINPFLLVHEVKVYTISVYKYVYVYVRAECYLLLTECVRRTAIILDRAMFHSSSVNARVTKPCVACNMWSSTTKNLQREKKNLKFDNTFGKCNEHAVKSCMLNHPS